MSRPKTLYRGMKAIAIVGKREERLEVELLGPAFPSINATGAVVRVMVKGETDPRKIAVDRIVQVTHPPGDMWP